MQPTANFAQAENIDRFFTSLKSLNELDKLEIRNIVRGLMNPTQRDICFTGNYYRAMGNVETLLSFRNVKDFQAIAMLARSLFELAVEVKLIGVIPRAIERMIAFSDVEKLRSAKKIVDFKKANPAAKVDATIYAQFIAGNEQRILLERAALWPGVRKLTHWSEMDLARRVERLKAPFDEIYAVNYPQLSWHIHSGLTGIVNLQKQSFALMAGIAFTVALEAYMQLLTAIIDEFKIEKADDKIKNKMLLAKMLPFTDTPEEAHQLREALLR